MYRHSGKLKRAGYFFALAVFFTTSMLATLPFVAPGVSAADNLPFTLVFGDDDRTGSELRAAAKDGGIGESDAGGVLAQTHMLTRGGRLGVAALAFDGDRSNKNDLPTYKLDYYCTPTDGYKLSVRKPNSDVPYVRYTMGVTVLQPNDWRGIVDDENYSTRVGLLGDNNVGSVHYPDKVVNSGSGGVSAKDFDLPASGSHGYGLRSGVNLASYFRQGDGVGEYDFKMYGAKEDIDEVLSRCLPNPDGDIGHKTSNFNKLGAQEKMVWNNAAKDSGIGEDVRAAGAASSTDAGATNPDCQSGGDPLNWILCPIFDGVAAFSDWIFQQIIQPLLRSTPISTDPEDPTYRIWSNFRIYGNIFLVIALLVIVFGQSIGGGLVDAYTAKKVLPRLVIATILINLSLYIVAALVDITNIVGGSIGALMTAPLQDAGAFKITPSGVQAGTILGVSAGTAGATFAVLATKSLIAVSALSNFLSFALLFIIIPVFLAMLAVFITLVLRQAFILALVLISPVAFALYCLPNTQQYFRKWWDFLIQTLLVYPIIIVFFAVADILSVTLFESSPNNPLAAVISFVLQFLPLIFIPYAFRLAGGALGRMHEVLSQTRKRTQEGIKGNANDPNSWRNRTKRNLFSDFNRAHQRTIDAGEDLGANRRRRLRGAIAGSGIFGNPDMRLSRYNKEMSEIEENMSQTGRDNLRYAAAGYKVAAGQTAFDGTTAGHDRWFNSKGKEISQNMYSRGKRYFGSNMSGVGSSLEYSFRKAQTPEDIAAARFAFKQNAVESDWNGNEMVDVWAQATFPHKDKWLSEWHSLPTPTDGKSGRGGVTFQDVSTDDAALDRMVNEGHTVKSQFQWSSVRPQDWHAMHKRMKGIEGQVQGVQSGAITLGSAAEVAAGTAHLDRDEYSANLSRYAKMAELVDSQARAGVGMMGDDGEVQVAGASAEVQGVLTAMSKNRRFGVTNAVDTASGELSLSNRVLYDRSAAVAPGPGGTARPLRGDALDTFVRNPANQIGIASDVSADRADIERQ